MYYILQFGIGVGIIQAILLGMVLFFFPGEKKTPSRIIALILFVSSLLMVSEILELFNLDKFIKPWLDVSILLDLLLAPLVWWLTSFMIGSKNKFQKEDWLHLLPFLLGFVWFFTGFQMLNDSVALFVLGKGIVLFFYLWITFVALFIRKKSSQPFLERMFGAFLIITLISYGAFWLMYFGVQLPIDSDYMGCLLMTTFVYFLTFHILKAPTSFIRIQSPPLQPKYYKSNLDQQLRSTYLEQLQNHLEANKPFLNKKLTLNELAYVLDITPNILSQVINEGLQKSFHELLNDYRLKEIKQKLLNPKEEHKTILALAFESGFQSKASFNRIFKKSEGLTPSAFRSKYKSQASH